MMSWRERERERVREREREREGGREGGREREREGEREREREREGDTCEKIVKLLTVTRLLYTLKCPLLTLPCY